MGMNQKVVVDWRVSVAAWLERVKGIEPSYAAWEAAVLPLNYPREGQDFTGNDRCSRLASGGAVFSAI